VGLARCVRGWSLAQVARPSSAPLFDTDVVDVRLPDGITTVSADADSLYVGTRFLGVMRIQKGKQTPLRLFDSDRRCRASVGGLRQQQ
jgi:hypothetical protein